MEKQLEVGRVDIKRVAGDSISSVALAIGGIGLPISLAALIFSDPLAGGLARATSAFVFGSAILAAWIAWQSGAVPSFASVQDAPAVIMVPVAASVASASGNPTDVLVLLALASLGTGIAMLLAGRFGVGAIVRYLPTTVVGAFMAGTGWFLAKGGISVMIGRDIGLGDVPDLFGSLAKLWLPGLLLAAAIILMGRENRLPPEAPSLAILGGAGLFYALTFATSSVAERDAEGWLIGPFPSGTRVEPLRPSEVSDLDPSLIADNLPALITVVMISTIALLLNLSGLEFADRKPLDQNRELKLTGIGNVLLAPFGALVGYVALGSSLLARKLGSRSRTVPLMAAGITAVVGLVGPKYVGFVPRFIAGGLLLAVGIDLMLERVQQLRVSAGWTDRILTAVIVASMATVGIIEGLVVGIVIACAIFVVRYSHIDPVHRESSGFHSSQVDRTDAEVDVLGRHSNSVTVYELQGYLFFGSAVGLAGQVRTLCVESEGLLAIVLDFRRVTGLDSSGFAVLRQIHDEAEGVGARLVLSGMSRSLAEGLQRTNPNLMTDAVVRPTLDEGLEWAENQILSRHGGDLVPDGGVRPVLSDSLRQRFSTVGVASGQVLLEQGQPGDTLFFVLRGSLVAVRIGEDGSRHRLRQFGANSWIGEVAFFAGGQRTADVVALSDVEALRLNRSDYEQMRQADPSVALELHDLVMAAQASRNTSLSIDLSRSMS